MINLEIETEVRSKNTPAITDYRQRCRERQRKENLRDYNFKEDFDDEDRKDNSHDSGNDDDEGGDDDDDSEDNNADEDFFY